MSSSGGILRPSAFSALRLTASSNLAGRASGFALQDMIGYADKATAVFRLIGLWHITSRFQVKLQWVGHRQPVLLG